MPTGAALERSCSRAGVASAEVRQPFTAHYFANYPKATLTKLDGPQPDHHDQTADVAELRELSISEFVHGFQKYFLAYDSSNFSFDAGFTSTSWAALFEASGGT